MRYGEYQPTGTEWANSIPATWDCKKISSLFSQRKVKVSDTEYAPLSVAKIGVVPQLDTAVKTDAGDNRKLVCAGDFVINSRSDRKGSCGVSDLNGSVSLINIVLTPRQAWNSRYVHYLLRSQPFSEEYYRYGRGIVADLWTTRYSEMKNILLPVPPREEQDQIARYLDWQVSKINRLIAAKKKQIALLKEQEQSVIDHVVIHGLDSLVKTKVSSVDWIGHIPIDWKSIKIRRFCTLQNGISESGEFFLTGSPFVSYGDVYKHLTLPETVNGVANSSYEQQQTFSVCKGDIFFTRTSETIDEVGMPTVCLHTIEKAVFSGFLIRVRPIEDMVSSDYLKYYLRYSGIQRYFARTMNIVIRASLGQNLLKELTILIPPQTEQAEIATYLDKKHEQFETIRVGIEKEIAALHDLRTRLISDAVTGQIDVRGIEIPDFEYAEEATEANDTEEAENETTDEQEE